MNTTAFPPVIRMLLIANGVVFLAQQLGHSLLLSEFALWPVGTSDLASVLYAVPQFKPWQLVTYSFLHGGILHLFFNMFALWMFGAQIEHTWGSRRLLVYYFVCVIGAGLVQLWVVSMASSDGGIYPTVGASGGVFGILLAFGMMFPEQRLLLLFPPIPIKAKWLVIGYGAIELWAGITGTAAGIAHFAHLGGMLFGLILILYWRGRLPIRPDRPMRW